MRQTISTALCLLLLAAAHVACAFSPAQDEALDASLREAVHSVPVAAAGANIIVTSFRPRGEGPFPWIVLSHGTPTTLEANRAIGRYRPLHPARQWVQKLWFESFRSAGGRGELMVAPPFPERRGHGLFPAPAGAPIWTAAVAAFFQSQGPALPF